jgi:hypothetical protein
MAVKDIPFCRSAAAPFFFQQKEGNGKYKEKNKRVKKKLGGVLPDGNCLDQRFKGRWA